ncbi:MAG: LamG-like jellyroll fold domain-containing protein [Blastocatellia bacterium]
MTNNAFHHVAATYDGATMKIYVDGNLNVQKAVTLTINYPSGRPLMIGKREYNSIPGPFPGVIDEVALYNRALSASEIQSIFNAGKFGKCSVTNVSAASFLGQSLASDSIVAVFGADLATGTRLAPPILPLPTELGGTRVKIGDQVAGLFFVSPTQVNFHMPPMTANGAASVAITNANGLVSYGAPQIAAVAPGLFSANADGQGVAAAVVFRRKANGMDSFEPVARFDPAQNKFVAVPIELGLETDQVFLILYGTGFRNRSALTAVTTTIGGANAEVLFAGAAPGFVGLDQANVRLSRSLIGRGEVDVALTVDRVPANIVRVNIR